MTKILFILKIYTLFSFPLYAATWKKTKTTPTPANTTTAGVALTSAQCPNNFIFVPKLSPYTVSDFCVAKFEMKDDGYGTAVSQASGSPWVNIDRPTARAACQALGKGYDLISNDQWQTIARNIAGVASNWSGNVVASGQLNRGHSDSSPYAALVAVTNDNDPCNGTGQACTSTTWDSQRRTHVLSNGNAIWDFSGNTWEWATNNSNVSNGADGYISQMTGGDVRQNRYGAVAGTFCATPGSSPYCGMGNGWFNYTAGSVMKGGSFADGVGSGVFASNLMNATTLTGVNVGFRCIYSP